MFGSSKAKSINAFWRAFLEREAEFARSIDDKDPARSRALMLELHEFLTEVHPALGCEFGTEGDALNFCVTPNGYVAAFEATREVVSAAPGLPGWNIHGFRQRKDLATMTIVVGDVAAEAKDVRYLAKFGSKVDIVLLYDLADDVDPELLYTMGVLMLDAALGEFDAATGIASLDGVNGHHPKSSPFLELPAAFDAWRAKVAN